MRGDGSNNGAERFISELLYVFKPVGKLEQGYRLDYFLIINLQMSSLEPPVLYNEQSSLMVSRSQ